MTQLTASAGARAESWAAAYLAGLGFRILRQNFRARRGEIDLIAIEDETLCFVEVRYRRREDFAHPSSTVTRLKQRRIARTASLFLATCWSGPPCACRFDVVTIIGQPAPEITLLRNAFSVPADSY